ncbi:MAG: sulfite oxidase [Thiohalobacterales bacterium]|nr:sulfite oxidase [Thiohalobacterales bacterium]
MRKKKRREIGLVQLYSEDPVRADYEVWGRVSDPVSRRGFLKKAGLATMAAYLGHTIPFADFMPAGLIPVDMAWAAGELVIEGKTGLRVLNDRPVNAETLAHELDDEITPVSKMFIRNNGIVPENTNPDTWSLEVSGESIIRPQTFSIAKLKELFKTYTYQLTVECGGNGRSGFYPPASGNQWSLGAVASPEWTGVRMGDVFDYCGIKDGAVYTGYYGADTHTSGNPKKDPISRGVTYEKAMEKESLIAWSMNGGDMHIMNGHPLRVVTAGWPGSTCGKWLNRLVLRDRVHDGSKMTGQSYRVPCNPVEPGAEVPNEDMCIIESMPVKSLITHPRSGTKTKLGRPFNVRGHAWAGDHEVRKMYVSMDFGATWQKAKLRKPANRLAWQHWSAVLEFPKTGYYEVWARAVDENGVSQTMVVPGWNPKGYLNNSCHRIAVMVEK